MSEHTLMHIHTHSFNKCLFNTYYVSDITTKPIRDLLIVFMEHDLESITLKHYCHPECAHPFQSWHNTLVTFHSCTFLFTHMVPTNSLENKIPPSLPFYPDD